MNPLIAAIRAATLPWRRARRKLATAVAAACVVAAPSAAYAHGNLKSATPAPNSQVTAIPAQLRLDFTESPELAFTSVRLLDPAGTPVSLGDIAYARDSHRSIIVPITTRLALPGKYTVVWKMAGADGHPMHGRYTFTILPAAFGVTVEGAAAAAVTAPAASPVPITHHETRAQRDRFAAGSPLYVAVRWLTFTALLVVLGALVFRLFVLSYLNRETHPHFPMLAETRRRTATVGAGAAAVLALATLLRLLAQSYAMHANDALSPSHVWPMLSRTVWGWGWLLQAAAVMVAWLGFRRATRGSGSGWVVATVGGVALAFTPALSGHAASAPRFPALAILADGVHVIGAGGWLGSLLFVMAAGIPATAALPSERRGAAVAGLVNAFSPTALVFAGTAAATGVFSAWLHLGTVAALWETRYGITLLVKLAVLSLVAATGAYNWLRVRPALGDDIATGRLRRSATIELAIGLVVLAVTAILVATPTAMDLQAMAVR